MDYLTQKCNGCGAVNSTGATTWVRVFGVALGNAANPIPVFRPPPPTSFAQRGISAVHPQIDFCPACAATVTVGSLPALYLKKT